jgi:hypothetical protein
MCLCTPGNGVVTGGCCSYEYINTLPYTQQTDKQPSHRLLQSYPLLTCGTRKTFLSADHSYLYYEVLISFLEFTMDDLD